MTIGSNGVQTFLKLVNVNQEDDLLGLDIIEARFLLDQIIMYSSLPQLRLHEVESHLGRQPTTL